MYQHVEFLVDRERRLLIRRVRGDARSIAVYAEFLDHYDRHPETLFYGLVTNYLDYRGRIDWEEMKTYARQVAERRAKHQGMFEPNEHYRRAAIVSIDPMMTVLVRAFPGVIPEFDFKVFRTEAEAIAWFEAPDGG